MWLQDDGSMPMQTACMLTGQFYIIFYMYISYTCAHSFVFNMYIVTYVVN